MANLKAHYALSKLNFTRKLEIKTNGAQTERSEQGAKQPSQYGQYIFINLRVPRARSHIIDCTKQTQYAT